VTQGKLRARQRFTEVLKQDSTFPLSVEKAGCGLYTATSGAIDSVPVPEVRAFEKEFLQYVETSHGRFESIAEKKALDDAI